MVIKIKLYHFLAQIKILYHIKLVIFFQFQSNHFLIYNLLSIIIVINYQFQSLLKTVYDY